VHLDIRWTGGNAERTRRYAADLVALAPDVILAFTSPIVLALQQATHSVPIVFAGVVDPVGSGLVASMARPGGSTTGFALFEYAIAAKWLDLLKEMAPHVTRAAVLRDATIAAGIGQFAAIQAVGPIGMELSVISLEDAGAVERAVAEFAHGSNGGLVVTASPFGANHPDLIPKLAARYKLPTVYPFHYFAAAGGLISYGPEFVEQSVQAADYIDRILKGEKPENLPVQAPTKYQLTVNLKAAKMIGLEMPPTLLNRADEVIE
jgi:putative ABC transport system substrate-binding protein